MSAFDPPANDGQPPSRSAAAWDKIKGIAEAYPYVAFVVGAFLLLGVVSFLVAIFRGSPQPPAAPAAVTVPAATPVAAPPPPTGFARQPSQAPISNVFAGPAVLPPTLPIDAPVVRGARMAFSLETTGSWQEDKKSWVEVSSSAVAAADSIASLTYVAARERFAEVWPGRFQERAVSLSGLAKIERAGAYAVVLNVREQGRCWVELGPRGNVVTSATEHTGIAASDQLMDEGFYRLVLACASQLRNTYAGGATVALRGASGAPRIVELFESIDAEPEPALGSASP